MGYVTLIFVALAFVSVLNCAPVDESPVKSAATVFSSTTTTVTPAPELYGGNKRQTDNNSSSDETKESDESSEEPKKRPTRDSEHSGALAQQTKNGPGYVAQPQSSTTKDVPKAQILPTRQIRDTYQTADVVPAIISASVKSADVSTLSTPASTSVASKSY